MIGKAIKLAKDSDAVTLSKFLASRVHLINKRNHKGSTCLHVACWKGKLDMCLMLLLRGSDINAQDKKGYSPLLVAVECEYAEIANTLVSRGANVHLFNVALSTPLHIAASNGLAGVIIPLLDKGADINALDINGYTPLIVSIRKNKIEVAMILLDRKADIFIKDPKDKKSAIDLAKACGHTGLLAMLKEREDVEKMLAEKKEGEARKDAAQSLLQGTAKKKKVKITRDKDDNSTIVDSNQPTVIKKKKKVKSGVEATDELSALGLNPKSKSYAKSVTTESVITASELSSVSTIKKLGSVVSNDRNITDDPWVKQVTRRRKKGDLSDAQSVGTNRTVKTRLQSLLYHNEEKKTGGIKTPNSKEKEPNKSSPYAICGTSPQYIDEQEYDNNNNNNNRDKTTFVFVDDDIDTRKSTSILCGSGTTTTKKNNTTLARNNNNNSNNNNSRNMDIPQPRDYGGRRRKKKGNCTIM